jgi:hypothetical protein
LLSEAGQWQHKGSGNSKSGSEIQRGVWRTLLIAEQMATSVYEFMLV